MADNDLTQRITLDDDISAKLERIGQSEQQFAREVDRTGEAAQGASRQYQGREQKLDRLKSKLGELVNQEERATRATGQSAQQSEESTRAAQRRDQQIQRIGRVLASEEDHQIKVNRRTRDTIDAYRELDTQGNKTSGALGRLRQSFGGVLQGIGPLLGPFAGVGAVAALFASLSEEVEKTNQRLRENARLAKDAAQAQKNLLSLDTTTTQQRDMIREAATTYGRDPNEGVRAFAEIASRRSTLPFDQKMAIYMQTLESGVGTDAPLTSMSNPLLTVQKYEPDINKAQNILYQTIQSAGETDPAKIGPLFAQYLGVGEGIGKLSVGQSAGAIAGATNLGLDPSSAVTGLLGITQSLLDPNATPQAKEILQRGQIDQTNIIAALHSLVAALQAHRINANELGAVVGREGLPVLSALSDPKRFADFTAAIDQVQAAAQSPEDLTHQNVIRRFRRDPLAALNFVSAQGKYGAEQKRASDTHALRVDAVRSLLEDELEKHATGHGGSLDAAEIEAMLDQYDENIAVYGLGPVAAAKEAAAEARSGQVSIPLLGLRTNLSLTDMPEGYGFGSEIAQAISQRLPHPSASGSPVNLTVQHNNYGLQVGGTKDPTTEQLDRRAGQP